MASRARAVGRLAPGPDCRATRPSGRGAVNSVAARLPEGLGAFESSAARQLEATEAVGERRTGGSARTRSGLNRSPAIRAFRADTELRHVGHEGSRFSISYANVVGAAPEQQPGRRTKVRQPHESRIAVTSVASNESIQRRPPRQSRDS